MSAKGQKQKYRYSTLLSASVPGAPVPPIGAFLAKMGPLQHGIQRGIERPAPSPHSSMGAALSQERACIYAV